jgi:hypothetical protein
MHAVVIVKIIPTTLKEEEKMRQAPSEDTPSPHFMLKAGLTIISWIRIISSFAHKLKLLIFYIALFLIRIKCYRTMFLFGFNLYPFAGHPD